MSAKSQSAPETEISPAEAAVPIKLHTWLKLQPSDEWSYCGVCRQIRHPNGKLDKEACRGYYKQASKPIKTRVR